MDWNDFPHQTDLQLESVGKMPGIFRMKASQSLVASTPVEQLDRVNAFDAYERWLIAHVRGNLQSPAAKASPPHQKPIRLKVKSCERKEGEILHFWVREVEVVVDSTDQLRVSFVLSNLSGRGKSLAYTREVTSPGCFTSWAQLGEQLRAAFLPVKNEYCQRPRPLSNKQGRRELHKYIQEMGELTASLVGNPLNKHIKVTVFMDGFRVSPARTQLFRVQPSTLEETLQVDLREEYSHRQVRSQPQRDQGIPCQIPAGRTPPDQFPWRLGPPNSAICFVDGKLDHFKHDVPAERLRRRTFPKPILKGLRQKPRPRDQGNAGDQ